MNPLVELNLALILFLPWFLILGALFWIYPREPRGAARRAYDVLALAIALAAFAYSQYWSLRVADPDYGRMWGQILATAIAYGVYLAVMTVAFFLRPAVLRAR